MLLNYDLIRIHAFALGVNIGGIFGHTQGLKGTGFRYNNLESTLIPVTESEYINRINMGGIIGGGLYYKPKDKRIHLSLQPINISAGHGFCICRPMLM